MPAALLRYCAYQTSVDLSACLSTLFSRLFRRENEFVHVFGVSHADANCVDITKKRAVCAWRSQRGFGWACNFACANFCPRFRARSQMPAFGLLSDPCCSAKSREVVLKS